MSVTVVRAYRFALDPTPGQVRDLGRHAGAARFAYNWALAAVKANLGQRDAERSYGVTDDVLTPALGWSLPALRRAWNAAKGRVAPWWQECSKEAFNTGLDGLARALKNFADSRSGKRQGRKVGFPTRKLSRRLEAGTARVLSATVRREAGRWYCAFTVEVTRAVGRPARPDAVVGVDLGIRTLAVAGRRETDVEPTRRPGPTRQVAVKRLPRTGQPGRTGTACW